MVGQEARDGSTLVRLRKWRLYVSELCGGLLRGGVTSKMVNALSKKVDAIVGAGRELEPRDGRPLSRVI